MTFLGLEARTDLPQVKNDINDILLSINVNSNVNYRHNFTVTIY